jgi:AcrR family transcriptional regulator
VAAERPRSDSERTRERLLDAAEKLFAAHGVHAISLRTVNAAAGARNVSAAHYHFGSKDNLIRALVARRMQAIAHERLAALAAVDAGARTAAPDLRAVVEAMVLPFFRLLGGDRSSVTFLARVSAEPGVVLDELAPPEFWAMVQRLAGLLHRALPHLPELAVLIRVRFLFQQTFAAVTDFERRARNVDSGIERQALETTVGELVDYVVGGLAAPSHLASEVSGRNQSTSPRGGRDEIAPRHVAARRSRRRRQRPGGREVSGG